MSQTTRCRVLAHRRRWRWLSKPGTISPVPAKKDPKDKTPVVLDLYGHLTAVDEPAWPGRVITLELTEAEFLPEGAP